MTLKEKQIGYVAEQIVKKVGGKTIKGEKSNIDTLYSFGVLGLETPFNLATMFYNSFEQARQKLKKGEGLE